MTPRFTLSTVKPETPGLNLRKRETMRDSERESGRLPQHDVYKLTRLCVETQQRRVLPQPGPRRPPPPFLSQHNLHTYTQYSWNSAVQTSLQKRHPVVCVCVFTMWGQHDLHHVCHSDQVQQVEVIERCADCRRLQVYSLFLVQRRDGQNQPHLRRTSQHTVQQLNSNVQPLTTNITSCSELLLEV